MKDGCSRVQPNRVSVQMLNKEAGQVRPRRSIDNNYLQNYNPPPPLLAVLVRDRASGVANRGGGGTLF